MLTWESFFYKHLRNECLFFWVHGEWIVARDKQIAWTARGSRAICLSRATIHSPWTPKKTLIPYIYNASNKDSFKNSPRKVINSKFPQLRALYFIWCINHCSCDSALLPNYLLTLFIGNWTVIFYQNSTKEIWYHCKYLRMTRTAHSYTLSYSHHIYLSEFSTAKCLLY